MQTIFNKERVTEYVVDNCGCSRSLMASWFDYFIYVRWIYTCSFSNRSYCDYNKIDSRQKSSITNLILLGSLYIARKNKIIV